MSPQEWKAQITNAEYGHGLTMSMEEHYWTFEQLQVCDARQDCSSCQTLRTDWPCIGLAMHEQLLRSKPPLAARPATIWIGSLV